MTAAESAGTGTAHYAVSTDGRTTWSVAKGTDGVRPIVVITVVHGSIIVRVALKVMAFKYFL